VKPAAFLPHAPFAPAGRVVWSHGRSVEFSALVPSENDIMVMSGLFIWRGRAAKKLAN
jgi:hypothetical protein